MIRRRTGKEGTSWQVYGRRDGRKVYVGSFASERDARSAERRQIVTQERIDAGELPPATDTKRTFGGAVKVWLKALADAASRSHDEYESRIDKHVLPTFEHVPIVDIRKSDVLRWRDELLCGKTIGAATVNTIVGTLSSAFRFFVESDWLEVNPCRGVKLVKHVAKVFPWLQSSEAITRLLSECTPNIRDLVAVLVGTGVRLDEALCMRWDDVDLEHRLLHVHRGRKGTTKAGRGRHVPIFDSVLPVLRAMKLRRGTNVYLWPGVPAIGARAEPRPLSQAAVRVPFKAAVELADVPSGLRLHDLRHTFASLFLIDGGDIFKLSRILGHSSVAITERTYAHLKPDAFEVDYGRVRFAMPGEARVVSIAAAR